jgi:hypothetical protein
MTTATANNPAFPLRRDLSIIAAAIATLAAVLSGGLALFDFAGQIGPMLSAAAACLLGSVAALAIMAWRANRGSEGVVQGAMLGMLVRVAICLGGGAAAYGLSEWSRESVAGWFIGFYVIALAFDVWSMASYSRRLDAPGSTRDAPHAAAGPSQKVERSASALTEARA